jgi:hypothetical protein
MVEILRLRRILQTKPQQFMLVMRDKVNRTEFGAEDEVRKILKAVGIFQPEIDKLFVKAKSESNPAA